MIQHVNTILVGKQTPATFTNVEALTVGDVALFDENRALIKTEADAVNAKAIHLGVAKAKVAVTLPDGTLVQRANVEFSNPITKDNMFSKVVTPYANSIPAEIVIDFANVKPVVDNRYVLRIVYKDIFEAPGQFTHTYEVFADSTDPHDLAKAFAKKINKHSNRRVIATQTTSVLTLRAMDKDDNEGLNSLSEYSIVAMEATVYTNKPNSFNAGMDAVPGIDISTKQAGHPGSGYWKQVRDTEKRNRGYKGHVFTGAYPEVTSNPMVEENATYDCITLESDNNYVSGDNRYVKNTPMGVVLYIKSNANLNTTVLMKAIDAFANGKVAA